MMLWARLRYQVFVLYTWASSILLACLIAYPKADASNHCSTLSLPIINHHGHGHGHGHGHDHDHDHSHARLSHRDPRLRPACASGPAERT